MGTMVMLFTLTMASVVLGVIFLLQIGWWLPTMVAISLLLAFLLWTSVTLILGEEIRDKRKGLYNAKPGNNPAEHR